jgi:uncharacterized membrane protein YheB (UPF0754 family)
MRKSLEQISRESGIPVMELVDACYESFEQWMKDFARDKVKTFDEKEEEDLLSHFKPEVEEDMWDPTEDWTDKDWEEFHRDMQEQQFEEMIKDEMRLTGKDREDAILSLQGLDEDSWADEEARIESENEEWW